MKFEKQLTIFQNKNLQNFCRLLRVDKERPQTRIQIAFNSDNLFFAVSETENSRTKSTNLFFSTEKTRGKFMLLSMKINTQKDLYYLRIFRKV